MRVSESKPYFPYYTDLALLYTVYTVAFVVCVAMAFVALIVALRAKINNTNQNQLKYMLLSSLFGFGGGSTAFFPVYDLHIYPFGMFFVIVYPMLMAYAIVRHRLLDIEVIIKKTLVFAGLSFFVFASFMLPFFLVTNVLGFSLRGQVRWWLFALVGMVVAAVVGPLNSVLINVTDKYLFQKKINYRLLLKEATEYLAHLDSLKKQARRIIAFLLVKARIANASIYAFQSHAPGSLLLEASRPPLRPLRPKLHKTILFSHPLANYLRAHRGPVVLEQLEERKKQEKDPKQRETFDEMTRLFKDHKAEAVIPCFGSESAERARRTELHLRGILFLGPQKSDESYTEEELDVFFTLGQESSIAFENARLYDEAVDRAQELHTINQELNDAQTKLLRALSDAQKSRREAETSREEALEAKKKTEEMELELLRRQRLVIIEKLVSGLAHEIFNAVQPMSYRVELADSVFSDLYVFYDQRKHTLSDEERAHMVERFRTFREVIHVLGQGMDHIFDVVDTLNQMRKGDDKTIKPFDFLTFWVSAHNIILMQTHGEILEEVPIVEDIPTNLPPVRGNTVQLTQVFLNLYRNALYAMNGRTEKKLSLSVAIDRDHPDDLTVTFADTGSGIPPEIMPRIFDFQFTTKGEKGQGIGLSICKTIIERFNGSVTCKSEWGKGTTFFIRLPIAKGKPENG